MTVNIFLALEVFLLLEENGVSVSSGNAVRWSFEVKQTKTTSGKKSCKLKQQSSRSFPIKNMKRINDTSVNLNIQPSIYIQLSSLASCKSDCRMQRAPYNRRKFNHFFLFQLKAHNILCAFSWNKKDWLIARRHGVERFKIGENLLFPASVDMIITNQINNATDNNISKISGILRSYIGKVVLWRSTVDNINWDMLPVLRQLRRTVK